LPPFQFGNAAGTLAQNPYWFLGTGVAVATEMSGDRIRISLSHLQSIDHLMRDSVPVSHAQR